jgi:hypothetical protein
MTLLWRGDHGFTPLRRQVSDPKSPVFGVDDGAAGERLSKIRDWEL